MHTIDPDRIGEDPRDANLERLAAMAVEEATALATMLPAALEYQWRRPAVVRPDVDTTERESGGHSDPTADVALDGRRLRLRAQVIKSERVLRDAVIAARGVRLGLEKALAAYEGE
jgi:hypothetical protein